MKKPTNVIVCKCVNISVFSLTDIRIIGEDLDISDGKDADGVVPLALVPVVVHLLLDVDDVSLAETQLTIVLGLNNYDFFNGLLLCTRNVNT